MTNERDPIADKDLLYKTLEPLIKEYLKEINLDLPVSSYLKELGVTPIFLNGSVAGFWGLQIVAVPNGKKRATVKAFYIRKEFRGKDRDRVADDFIKGLSTQGVTDLEIWAYPEIQNWLESRYDIKTNIHVTYNPIQKFMVFKNH